MLVLIIGFMDTLGKAVAENYASKLFKTEVVIKKVDTSFFNRTATIENIVVANPKGFKAPSAFSMKKIQLEIGDDNSIVVIKKLNFDGLYLELTNDNKRINLYELYNNLTKNKTNSQSKSKKTQPNIQKENKKSEIKVIITELKFTNISVVVNNKNFKKVLKIDNIIVRDFGKKEGGVPVSQIAKKLMKFVLDKMEQRIKEEGSNAIKKEFDKQVESITKKAKSFFKGLGF
jgi:hypothetical protein